MCLSSVWTLVLRPESETNASTKSNLSSSGRQRGAMPGAGETVRTNRALVNQWLLHPLREKTLTLGGVALVQQTNEIAVRRFSGHWIKTECFSC